MSEEIKVRWEIPLKMTSQDGHRSWSETAIFEATGTPEKVEDERKKFITFVELISK